MTIQSRSTRGRNDRICYNNSRIVLFSEAEFFYYFFMIKNESERFWENPAHSKSRWKWAILSFKQLHWMETFSFDHLCWQKHLLIRPADLTHVAWKVFWTHDPKLIPFLLTIDSHPWHRFIASLRSCIRVSLLLFSHPGGHDFKLPLPGIIVLPHGFGRDFTETSKEEACELRSYPVATSEWKSQGHIRGGSVGPTDQWNTLLSIKVFRDLTLYSTVLSVTMAFKKGRRWLALRNMWPIWGDRTKTWNIKRLL